MTTGEVGQKKRRFRLPASGRKSQKKKKKYAYQGKVKRMEDRGRMLLRKRAVIFGHQNLGGSSVGNRTPSPQRFDLRRKNAMPSRVLPVQKASLCEWPNDAEKTFFRSAGKDKKGKGTSTPREPRTSQLRGRSFI